VGFLLPYIEGSAISAKKVTLLKDAVARFLRKGNSHTAQILIQQLVTAR
jgi:hypothetical protein